jgi:thiol-disulfide isomerase/thioredoxin
MPQQAKTPSRLVLSALLLALLGACSAPAAAPVVTPTPENPEWFGIELTDVVTDEVFTINDYAGKVVLLETMAIWCPSCALQAHEVRKLHTSLGDDEDLISISLDVDVNEDAAALKEYAEEYGFEWHFAVAPLGVARALGNLYTAQYLNPPLSPMLIIDRSGEVHHLEYGRKSSTVLLEHVGPYLSP